jgi:hypothetical protein
MFYFNIFLNFMTKRLNHRLFFVFLMSTLLAIMALSCGEDQVIEKIVDVPGDTVKVARKLNYNFIETFSVDLGAGEAAMQASVRGDSIYLYWPQYLPQPENITPVITVADKAGVQPASETQIAFETGVTYTVTAEDGSQKKYVLKVVINQALPWFEATVGQVEVGTEMILNGDFFIPDAAMTHVYMIAEGSTVETELTIVQITETRINVQVPADFAMGPYKVKVRTGWRVAYDREYDTIDVVASPI